MYLSSTEILDIMRGAECECYGMRADRSGLNAGDDLPLSHQWMQDYQDYWESDWSGDPYDDPYHPYNKDLGCWDAGELIGTCALYLSPKMSPDQIEKIISEMRYYLSKNAPCIYLIGGDDMENGNDINETIIENARVLAIVSDEYLRK
jgi:hypothetical protein